MPHEEDPTPSTWRQLSTPFFLRRIHDEDDVCLKSHFGCQLPAAVGRNVIPLFLHDARGLRSCWTAFQGFQTRRSDLNGGTDGGSK